MPVIFGATLATTIGAAKLNWLLFILSFLGMAILHTGSNLLNDVYDFKQGIDQRVNPVSGAVVRGWITPREGIIAGWFLLVIGSAIGIFIVLQTTILVFWIGLIGVLVGIFYTWGPWPLKFHALGDLAVFLNFGLLGSLGAWTVQTGQLSLLPVIWTIPMSLLVVAILHANNWRDILGDRAGGIQTMAALLGDNGSNVYYHFLLLVPIFFVLTLLLSSHILDWPLKMPYTFLIVLIALPKTLALLKIGRRRHNPVNPLDFVALDGATAQLNTIFGLLCTLSLVLHYFIS